MWRPWRRASSFKKVTVGEQLDEAAGEKECGREEWARGRVVKKMHRIHGLGSWNSDDGCYKT